MNNKLKRKAFTIVELVIVIAVIAILAAVLIPTFSSIVKKAEESAYLQDRTNQQLQDLIEKLENPNYMTWEDFESILAEKLAGIQAGANNTDFDKIKDQINAAIEALNSQNNGLTKDQIESIIEKALEGQLTTAQVQAIVNAALKDKGVDDSKINDIITSAIEELRKETGDTGITPEQMQAAINAALDKALAGNQDDIAGLKTEIATIIGKLNNNLTQEQIEAIIKEALGKLENNNSDKPTHTHTACATCGKCTANDCDGTENDKCQGHASVDPTHTHTACTTCGKCTAADCNGTDVDKCQGHTPADPTHTHTACATCGKCIAADCNGTDADKCQGHDQTEHTHELTNGICECGAEHYICSYGTCTEVNKYLTSQDLTKYTAYPNVDDAYYCKDCNLLNDINKGAIKKCTNVKCEICNRETDEPENPGGNQGGGNGSDIVVNDHKHDYSTVSKVDNKYHKGTCNICGYEVKETHYFNENGRCNDCGAENEGTILTITCNNGGHTYQVKTDKSGAKYLNKNNEWKTLEKCAVDSHTNCYDCPDPDHKGCFGCQHPNALYADDTNNRNTHSLYCPDCLVRIEEDHPVGTCKYCGHHECIKVYTYLNENTHQWTCEMSACNNTAIERHSAGSPSAYNSDAYGHSGTCKDCDTYFTAEHSFSNGDTCSTCLYKKCNHIDIANLPSPEYTGWTITDTTHKLVCIDCGNNKMIIKETTHDTKGTDGECSICKYKEGMACAHVNIQNNTCQGCNKYIIKDSSTFTTNLTTINGNYDILFELGENPTTITVKTLTISPNKNVIIDLNGHTINISQSILINSGASLTIKNGTLKSSGYISAAGSKIYLENISIYQTGSGNGLITGSTNSNINIINCENIDVSGSTNKRVIYFHSTNINNVEINITGSNFTDSTLLYFNNATQNNMSNNKITINGTPSINGTDITKDNVKNFINEYGQNININ